MPVCEKIAPIILRKPVPQCGLGAHSPKNRDPNPSGIGRGRPPYGAGQFAPSPEEECSRHEAMRDTGGTTDILVCGFLGLSRPLFKPAKRSKRWQFLIMAT